MAASSEAGQETRERVLSAAVDLLTGGREALTTRAVAAAACVQAPTIYRLFRHKQGLVDAVAERGFTAYLQQKRTVGPHADPVDNLRHGWDLHIGFGLANPAIFSTMYGEPRAGGVSPAASQALSMLRDRMRTLALAGRLRVDERRAADMLRAAACGVVFILLELPEGERDPDLSRSTREAVIAAITTGPSSATAPDLKPVAMTLRALLPGADELSTNERHLLAEWLERIVRSTKASDGQARAEVANRQLGRETTG